VKEKNLWGYINEQGNYVIKPQYSKAGSFSNGLAPVYTKTEYSENGKKRKSYAYVYINKDNKIVLSDRYSIGFDFAYEKAIVIKKGKYGIINTTGKNTAPFAYNYLERFEGYDLYKARKGKNKFAIINGEGIKLIPFKKYEKIGEFGNDLCPIMKNRIGFYIDTDGNKKIHVLAHNLGNFKFGKALIFRNSSYEYIDTEGNTILTFASNNTKYNYLENENDTIINPEHQLSDSLYYFINNRNKNGKYNLELINSKSDPVLYSFTQEFMEFSEGFAAYGVSEVYGMFDIKGNKIIDSGYVDIEKVASGLYKLTSLNEIRYIKLWK